MEASTKKLFQSKRNFFLSKNIIKTTAILKNHKKKVFKMTNKILMNHQKSSNQFTIHKFQSNKKC